MSVCCPGCRAAWGVTTTQKWSPARSHCRGREHHFTQRVKLPPECSTKRCQRFEPKPDFILPAWCVRGELRGKTENTVLIPPQNQLTVPGGGNSSLPLTSHLPAWHLASFQGAKETHFPVPADPAWTAPCYILWKVKKLPLNTTTSRWWLPRELKGTGQEKVRLFWVFFLCFILAECFSRQIRWVSFYPGEIKPLYTWKRTDKSQKGWLRFPTTAHHVLGELPSKSPIVGKPCSTTSNYDFNQGT